MLNKIEAVNYYQKNKQVIMHTLSKMVRRRELREELFQDFIVRLLSEKIIVRSLNLTFAIQHLQHRFISKVTTNAVEYKVYKEVEDGDVVTNDNPETIIEDSERRINVRKDLQNSIDIIKNSYGKKLGEVGQILLNNEDNLSYVELAKIHNVNYNTFKLTALRVTRVLNTLLKDKYDIK